MNPVRKFFESIVFAGLRPAQKGAPEKRLRWLGPLREPVERFLSGGAAPDDPLYLTNRSWGQRARLGLLIAVPFLLVGVVLFFALGDYLTPQEAPQQQLTPAQIAEKMLPNLDKDLHVQTNHDLEVEDVHVEHGAAVKLSGVVKNNTDHAIENAELVFDLTNDAGSRLGAVSTTIARVDAHSSTNFSFPVPQQDAAFALVREVNTQ
jgi:hypothetical protein